jgi:hypothetical protein
MAYFENPGMLRRQFEFMEQIPVNARDRVQLIVVDDGSPQWPAQPADCCIPLQIYRIDVNVRWNQDAARNIAVHHARTPWILLTDMDHMVPRRTWERALNANLDPRYVYKFSRISEPEMQIYKPHPNSWLMTRLVWEQVGGYDERFAGFYGSDADFRDRIKKITQIFMFEEVLIRVPREVTPDASTTTWERKSLADKMAIPRIRNERFGEADQRPKRLTFPYHRVT